MNYQLLLCGVVYKSCNFGIVHLLYDVIKIGYSHKHELQALLFVVVNKLVLFVFTG